MNQTDPSLFSFQNVKVVCFDLWQTLADSVCKPSDLFFRHKDLFDVDIEAYREGFRFSEVYTSTGELRSKLGSLLDSMGAFTKDKKEIFLNDWFLEVNAGYLRPSALRIIPVLASRSYTLVLMSNTDMHSYDALSIESSLPFFDFRVLSCEVGYCKPDLQFWRLVRDRYGIQFHEMLMVGDDIEVDLKPARSLGMHTIHVQVGEDLDSIPELLPDRSIFSIGLP